MVNSRGSRRLVQTIDAPPDFRLLRLSSEGLPAADRFEVWRDMVTRKLMRLAIDPVADLPFQANAMLRSQHGLTIGVGQIGPNISHRTREIVAADNDDFVLVANLDGPFIVSRNHNELTLEAGEATLISCAEAGSYIRPTAGRILCARLPRTALSALVPDPDASVGQLIDRRNGPLRLLMSYADALWDDSQAVVGVRESRFVVDHLFDLVGLTVGARGDAAEFAAARGLRAAKLKAVKTCIEERIGPQDLDVDDVAVEVGVSPRYVRKLLESDGYSFSRYVTERRLERARGMLISPRHSGMGVAAIAYEVGFGDLSYFNRAFRRFYDATPRDVRAGAQ
jgi:AraC-like DNA-binding protein